MDEVEKAKLMAAKHAFQLIHPSHRVIGIGTGSTVEKFIQILSEKRELFHDKVFVASSIDTALRLREHSFKVLNTTTIDKIDVYIDGADEVDPAMNMIKGGGAAHVLEKILAYNAKTRIFIVDYTKLVRRLGEKHPVPVEVLPEAALFVYRKIMELGLRADIRRSGGGKYGVVVSDTRGVIIDIHLDKSVDVFNLERILRDVPGIIGTGFFIGLADKVIIGYPDHVEIIEKPMKTRHYSSDYRF